MTNPELREWPPSHHSHRRSEVSAIVGSGDAVWERAARDVLRWRVKTASGFTVDSTGPVSPGERVVVTARVSGVTIVEPVEVVFVVEEPGWVGFAYRTLPGHPVSGEEAFVVHRQGEEVRLTIRSLTRAAPQQPWRVLYPLLRIAQRIARRRYLRALR
jgi:uncharacterized protein (UPF0548 family)